VPRGLRFARERWEAQEQEAKAAQAAQREVSSSEQNLTEPPDDRASDE
jgi:hypothetical protein